MISWGPSSSPALQCTSLLLEEKIDYHGFDHFIQAFGFSSRQQSTVSAPASVEWVALLYL